MKKIKSEQNIELKKKTDFLEEKRKKKIRIVLILLICLLLFAGGTTYVLIRIKKEKFFKSMEDEFPIELINYNDYFFSNALTLKDKKVYQLNNNKFEEIGEITKNQNIMLIKDDYLKDGYFLIKDTSYYIDYKDIEEYTEEQKETTPTYLNYIPYNESVKTDSTTTIYSDTYEKIITLNKGIELPILIKEDNYYGVLLNNKLYYLKKDEVKKINKTNTSKKHTNAIATLVYHFVYDVNDKAEGDKCRSWNETICLSSTQFKEHMS